MSGYLSLEDRMDTRSRRRCSFIYKLRLRLVRWLERREIRERLRSGPAKT